MAESGLESQHSPPPLQIGFVPLIDAAPLIVARERGFFKEEGLRVALHRQIGWGNIRDKLTFGQLAASHALVGMPPVSVLGRDEFAEPLVSIAALGSGGNAITLSRRLTSIGVTSGAALARFVARREGRPLVLAHVFSCSTHHYLLREWLSSAGIDPDRDTRLCVLPPSQMVRQMAQGGLDGFCAGEPWNTLAEDEKEGAIVADTTEIAPHHPEKVLAVSRKWLDGHREIAERLVRAVLRGCAFCEDADNANDLARMLALPRYLDAPLGLLARSLSHGVSDSSHRFRSWARASTYPSAARVEWLLEQMIRLRHLPANTDARSVARRSIDVGPYHKAAQTLGWPTPKDDRIPAPIGG